MAELEQSHILENSWINQGACVESRASTRLLGIGSHSVEYEGFKTPIWGTGAVMKFEPEEAVQLMVRRHVDFR